MPVEPAQLANFMKSLADGVFEGCNVTIPHKEEAFKLVTPADDATRRLGVVNTVFVRNNRLFGTSTDGEGFLASLGDATGYQVASGPALVIGAGGAAVAVVGALTDAGAPRIFVANRTTERAEQLRRHFGKTVVPVDMDQAERVMADCRLLVNTTSLGMSGYGDFPLRLDHLPEDAVVYDIVYVPLETMLLKMARARGNPAVGGLGMLLHQAVRGFELWFGRRPEVTQELFEIVAADVLRTTPK
jgi:shikimate dehydrogenase